MFAKSVRVKLYGENRAKVKRVDKVRYPLTEAAFQEVYRAVLTGTPYPIKALMVALNIDGSWDSNGTGLTSPAFFAKLYSTTTSLCHLSLPSSQTPTLGASSRSGC